MGDRKPIITDEQSSRISFICNRLQNSVSPYQIINWLANFSESEWDLGLRVLERLIYFTIADIIYEFDEGLKKILANIPETEVVYIHGLGDFGKSGSSLIYYVKKTPTYASNESRFRILSHIKKMKQQGLRNNSRLILVDDIIGSGKSVIKYFNHNIKQQLTSEKFKISSIVLCIAYMEESKGLLDKNIENLTIYGTEYVKAFASGSSPFGYRPKMLPVRELCYKYGIGLFEVYDRDLRMTIKHPLGYNNSQSLVVFAHSAPNNTLPIIWSNKNGWRPLYPRSSHEKISQAKSFRNETLYWLNVAYKLEIMQKNEASDKIYFKGMNYRLLAVLRLKRKDSVDSIICQVLGISINELGEVLSEGVKQNIFDKDLGISEYGIEIYKQIRAKIKIVNRKDRRKFTIFDNSKLYVPKTFLGKT